MAGVRQKPSGTIGIKFGATLTGDREAVRKLALLSQNIQKKVLRLAVAAGARPAGVALRKAAKSASAASKRHEGIGTTSRAISVKAAMSKRQEGVAYAVIGARRGYYEIAELRAGRSRGHSGAVKSVTKFQSRRNRRGTKHSVKYRKLIKLSASARKARLRPTNGLQNANKRVPSRYLHLQEKGRHKTPPTWAPPNPFMFSTASTVAADSKSAMTRVLKQGIEREARKLANT